MRNIFDMSIKDIYDEMFRLERIIEEKDTEILRLKTINSFYEEREANHE